VTPQIVEKEKTMREHKLMLSDDDLAELEKARAAYIAEVRELGLNGVTGVRVIMDLLDIGTTVTLTPLKSPS
jgi:hypothetical protein